MAFSLSALLGLTGFIRAALFRTPPGETIAVVASLCASVAISVGIGSTLPLAMKRVGIDPAHSSTTIQVVITPQIYPLRSNVCFPKISAALTFTVIFGRDAIEMPPIALMADVNNICDHGSQPVQILQQNLRYH